MKRNWLILLGFMLTGSVIGLVLMVIGDQPKWERISTPPPALVKLGNEDSQGIHALDGSGHWYNCPGGSSPCTELASADQPTQTVECPLNSVRPTPNPPLPIVSQRVYYLCSLYPVREDTIITSDGSMWRSAQNNGTDTPLVDNALRCVFVGVWAVLGLIAYAVYKLVEKVRHLAQLTASKPTTGNRR